MEEAQPPIEALSDELLLWVLAFADVPDILSFSRTCHRFRYLSLDPILHVQRRQTATQRLSDSLGRRPSLSSLLPPQSAIYLSTTHVLARKLSRQLVSIRLSRNLSRRPSASSLVESNILPQECYRCNPHTGELVSGGRVAPSIVDVKRRVERERVKDGLRTWLEKKADTITRQKKREEERPAGVRSLVRRFTSRKCSPVPNQRWGEVRRNPSQPSEAPTRAHVYGLRRFWEGMAKSQGVDTQVVALV